MFLSRLRNLSERGDTLVEVLISIAVLSMVLGGAFVVTNSSLQGSRAAQERVNALKIVEGQLEQIKNLAANNSAALFGPAVPPNFCVASSLTVVSSSNAACAVGTDGTPTTVEPTFHIVIAQASNTFTITTTWYSVRGGQNNISMKYRVYQ